jgi:hypothetical protein
MVSFLRKVRTVIHTTPVLRQVSQTFANAWGGGEAYKNFDKKIGIGDSGEPVPAPAPQTGFGYQDLASLAAAQYPQTAALVNSYRQFAGATPQRYTAQPALGDTPMLIEDEDYSDDDYYDDGYDDEET